MAVSRKEFIFGAFLLNALSSVIIIVTLGTNSWVVSEAATETQVGNSDVNYGLFVGTITLRPLATPAIHSLHVTCVFDVGVCAPSCKTTRESRLEESDDWNRMSSFGDYFLRRRAYFARSIIQPMSILKVRAMANGLIPQPTCSDTVVLTGETFENERHLIPVSGYISLVLFLALTLAAAVLATFLAAYNTARNPVEPILGILGIRILNVIASTCGLVSLIAWGAMWPSLRDSGLGLTFVAAGQLSLIEPRIGYSYWILLMSVFCHLTSIGLLHLRHYLLERDPPPPTINIEANQDGTIFLY